MDPHAQQPRSLLLSALALAFAYQAGKRRGRFDELLAQDSAEKRRMMNTRGFRAPHLRRERHGS